MLRRFDFRSVLVAIAFFTVGFLVADRMTRAEAAPAPSVQEGAQSFSGTDGAMMTKINGAPTLIVLRAAKIWRVDLTASGHNRSIATIGE